MPGYLDVARVVNGRLLEIQFNQSNKKIKLPIILVGKCFSN